MVSNRNAGVSLSLRYLLWFFSFHLNFSYRLKLVISQMTFEIFTIQSLSFVEARWPRGQHGYFACLRIDWSFWSGFDPWPGTLCRVLGQDTGPHFTHVYKQTPAKLLLGETLQRNAAVASHTGRSKDTPSHFMLQKPEISSSLGDHLDHMQNLPLHFT